jgi:hypothetical protein
MKKKKINKVIRNGLVAVIISPGFGAGWWTWNRDRMDMIFDPGLVDLLERKQKEDKILAYATLKWPGAYLGGVEDLTLEWVLEGTEFKINEYDGSESIELKESDNWLTA